MAASIYTAITFAPVQGFIEKSRKLRDLYGSSFILSFLSRALCDAAIAEGHGVISPASINVTQGTPNQVVIRGDFSETAAHQALLRAWKAIVNLCRDEVEHCLPEAKLPGRYTWHRAWDAWGNHAWECFWAQGADISDARERLNEVKRSRAWVGVNWQGESSTLSGADAIAWYGMTEAMHPKASVAEQVDRMKAYCRQLSAALPNSIVDETEQLSIPELIKRVLMLQESFPQRVKAEFARLGLPAVEPPKVFTDINRFEAQAWTGWFQGDGDRIGQFLKSQGGRQADSLHAFSTAMLDWGHRFQSQFEETKGRVIYAGGDDFLGVLYRNEPDAPLTGQEVLAYFEEFPTVWAQHGQRDAQGKLLTVSVGVVWVAPQVPQRDVLQHCKEAEKAAKRGGRDRLCLRVLFNGGNYIEWLCPWWLLAGTSTAGEEPLFKRYRDRNGKSGPAASWGHFFEDVATLEARHGFRHDTDVALALLDVYFGEALSPLVQQHGWDDGDRAGVLGNQAISAANTQKRLNQWVINLAKVGFHLHRKSSPARSTVVPTAA